MTAPNLIFQAHFEDHVTPILQAFNDAFARGGDAPGLPENPVFIEATPFRGGGSIRLLPSSALLKWMSEVMDEHEMDCMRRWEARDAAKRDAG